MPLVLIVDDDEGYRRPMARLLQLEGYQVRTAAHGREALAVLEDCRPDLILLDLNMPVMDGLSFLQVIRADERYRHMPVLLLSNEAEGGVRAAARHLASGECSAKSCGNVGDFLAALRQQLPPPRNAAKTAAAGLPVVPVRATS